MATGMTTGVNFVLKKPTQVFVIGDVRADQQRWLDILSDNIPSSAVSDAPIKPSGVNFGLFGFHDFRMFMGQTGFEDAVLMADTIYRNTK